MTRVLALLGLGLLACESVPSELSPVDVDAQQLEPTPDVEPPAAEREAMLGVFVPEAEVVLVSTDFARIARLELGLGDHVEQGQLIAELDIRGQQTELAVAEAALHAATAELERLELELAQARHNRADLEQLEGYVSAAELREQQHAEALANARKRNASAELRQRRSRLDEASTRIAEADIRAPFSGVVAQRHADAGAILAPGDPVIELLSDTRLLRFAVPEAYTDQLALGTVIEARFEDGGSTVSGRVVAIAPEIDAGTRLVLAEAQLELSDRESTRVGAVARVRFVEPAQMR